MIEFKYVPRAEWMRGRMARLEPSFPPKTAYVWSGGGMRASFGAGVSEALEELHVPEPDFEIAISGNIGNRIYAKSGQVLQYSRKIWRDRLCGGKFICDNSLNLDRLISIFDEECPLDTAALRRNESELFMPALDMDRYLVRYFSNRDRPHLAEKDFRHWFLSGPVRAGMAHPYAYHKKVMIDYGRHIDGGFGVSLAAAVELAAERGAKRILVVDNENGGNAYDWLYAGHAWWKNRQLGKRLVSRLWKNEAVLPDDVQVTLIAAPHDVAGLLCDDADLINATIDAGRKAALANPAMREYIRSAA